MISYKSDEMRRFISTHHHELHYFVEKNCRNCKKKCIIPSMNVYKCLSEKVNLLSENKKDSEKDFPGPQITELGSNSNDVAYLKKGECSQLVFDMDHLLNKEEGLKNSD